MMQGTPANLQQSRAAQRLKACHNHLRPQVIVVLDEGEHRFAIQQGIP
jgi:hypothetical protein